jgi:phospholipase D1/2
MGGIDLCYSRYDTKDHKLFDDENYEARNGYFPGLDYSNVMIKDFDRPTVAADTKKEPPNDKETPRMPWYNFSIQYYFKA